MNKPMTLTPAQCTLLATAAKAMRDLHESLESPTVEAKEKKTGKEEDGSPEEDEDDDEGYATSLIPTRKATKK